MKVPFINYPRAYQAIKPEIDQAILGCLERGDLIYRDDLIKFERDFAKFCGCTYGIGTGSCTGAMFIALKALGIGPGDEVITVSHTYIATIDVIVAVGATPILIDVREDQNMNPDLIEPAITPRTKAIIPVHLNGRMCEMDKIQQIAYAYRLKIIEDAAQALGAKYKGRYSGSYSDIACFSFYPAKTLGSYGEAGAALTNNLYLSEDMWCLRDHGEYPNYRWTINNIKMWGYNTILDNIQAAVLNVKLKYLPEWIRRRNTIALRYLDGFVSLSFKKVISPPFWWSYDKTFDICQNFVIRVLQERDELQQFLAQKGIETQVKWRIPNHKQKALHLDHFNLPVTEQLSREVLSLPIYPELTDEEVQYVIDCMREFYG